MTTLIALLTMTLTTSENLPQQSYREAYRQHQEEGRPLVVLVGADWCPACRVMKGQNLVEAARNGVLKEVAFTTVDVDSDRRLANGLMRGGSIPQLVMFYRDGEETRRVQLTGAHDVAAIARFIESGLPAAASLASE